ncbi:MAG: hypothetical protein COB02_06885 [Candidatus Cloacimonadota bacterium]|nr:MAG: hypothetical protein COB02_06885 [Candidatus Cloacimonadota bacterium]
MKYFFLFFFINYNMFALSPELKIPEWYQASLSYKKIPEINNSFIIEFVLSSTYAKLQKINVNIIFPENVILLEGEAFFQISNVEKGKKIKKIFVLKSNQEIEGLPFQIKLNLEFPKKDILSKINFFYPTEDKQQLKKLIKKINDMPSKVELIFQKPIYILKTEGFKEIPSIIFSTLFKRKLYKFSFILFSSGTSLSAKNLLNKIIEFEEGLNSFMADAQSFETYVSSYLIEYNAMLQENYYDYYQLAILKFKDKKYKEADKWLQKLSSILPLKSSADYDFFLMTQNLRALCNLKDPKKSIKILKSAIKNTKLSKLAYYLMYNLSVIYESHKNKKHSKHYLNQSLNINPSFTLAKTMKKKVLLTHPLNDLSNTH